MIINLWSCLPIANSCNFLPVPGLLPILSATLIFWRVLLRCFFQRLTCRRWSFDFCAQHFRLRARGLGNCFASILRVFVTLRVRRVQHFPFPPIIFHSPFPLCLHFPHPRWAFFMRGVWCVANIFLSGNRMAKIYSLTSAGGQDQGAVLGHMRCTCSGGECLCWLNGRFGNQGRGISGVTGHRLPGKIVDGNYQARQTCSGEA